MADVFGLRFVRASDGFDVPAIHLMKSNSRESKLLCMRCTVGLSLKSLPSGKVVMVSYRHLESVNSSLRILMPAKIELIALLKK